MIKKVVNGEAKAVSRIYKRSYNLFNADVFSLVELKIILYDKNSQTITLNDAYANNTKKKLKDFAPHLEVGKTYVLSFVTTANNKYLWLTTARSAWTIGRTRTITEDDLSSSVVFYGEVGKTHTLSKFQIVEGAETKPYVPYLLDVNKVKKVVDGTAVDVFTHVTSEVADGVMEVSPAEVADGVLTIKGDNVKVENNKLIIL